MAQPSLNKGHNKSAIDPAIIEELLKDYQKPEDLTVLARGIMEQLTKRLSEWVLGAEMTHYLGYEKGQAPKLEADQARIIAKRPKPVRINPGIAVVGRWIRWRVLPVTPPVR
jgi:hypothetical protein